MNRYNIAIFASGKGSNANQIMHYFNKHESIRVAVLIANKQNIGALKYAEKRNVPSKLFTNSDFEKGETILSFLSQKNVDFIVLAGFLRKLPLLLINKFDERIINIHPSLLPKYGGKGMYGDHVHRAVLANGDAESGITIHLVAEEYDNGKRIAQFFIPLNKSDNLNSLKSAVQQLEHSFFPHTIEQYILNF